MPAHRHHASPIRLLTSRSILFHDYIFLHTAPEEFSGDGDRNVNERTELLDDEENEQLTHPRAGAERGKIGDNLL